MLKAYLVLFSYVGALFNFNYFTRLNHFKTMSASRQQNYITFCQYPAFKVVLGIIVKINAYFTRLNEQYFLGMYHFSWNSIVPVWRNDITLGSVHIAQLLREIVFCKERDSFFFIVAIYYYCKSQLISCYFFYHLLFFKGCNKTKQLLLIKLEL